MQRQPFSETLLFLAKEKKNVFTPRAFVMQRRKITMDQEVVLRGVAVVIDVNMTIFFQSKSLYL